MNNEYTTKVYTTPSGDTGTAEALGEWVASMNIEYFSKEDVDFLLNIGAIDEDYYSIWVKYTRKKKEDEEFNRAKQEFSCLDCGTSYRIDIQSGTWNFCRRSIEITFASVCPCCMSSKVEWKDTISCNE